MADPVSGDKGPPLLQTPPAEQRPAPAPAAVQPSLDLNLDQAPVAIPLKARRGEPPTSTMRSLGFQRDPFGAGDEVFFAGGDRQRHLAYLQHLSQWPQGLLVVTGRAGSGRSTMFKALSAGLSGNTKAARISAPPRTGEALVRRVCNGLALPVAEGADESQLRSQVADHAKRLEAAGRTALVMLDDGQDLTQDALLALVRLADVAERTPALRVVVFAHPQFVGALAKIRDKLKLALPWHQIVLSALTPDETRAYLKLRITAAGYSGKTLFSEAAIQAIHQQSEGLPGRINTLASAALAGNTEPAGAQQQRLWPLPLWHGVAVLAAVLVVLPGIWLLLPDTPAADGIPEYPAVATGSKTPMPDLHLPPLEQPAVAAAVADDNATVRPRDLKLGTMAPATPMKAQPEPAGLAAADQGWPWLTSQAAGNWTLQLVGLSDRSRAETFVAAQAQPEHLHLLATRRNGRPWYLVLHGSYSSRGAAERAAAALSEAAVPDLPWTRSMAALQALTPLSSGQ